MKASRFLAALLAVLILCSVCPLYTAAEDAMPGDDYDGYIVALRADAVLSPDEAPEAEPLGFNMYLVETPADVCAMADAGAVEEVDRNYRVELYGAMEEPGYAGGEQWYLGAYPGLETAAAWARGLDGSGVTIAVLDTGIFLGHEEFENTRFVGAYNATNDGGSCADVTWHGTGVVGVLAASVNGSGLVGAAYNANIMPVRVFDRDGLGYVSYIVNGLHYAVSQGADVINMSLGTESKSSTLIRAVNEAINAGVIVVAAAGNDGNAVLNYPAAVDRVIGVGSVNSSGEVSGFSQKNQSVFVTAPGEGIATTYAEAGFYITTEGTSFAAPCVTALAALAKQYANENGLSLTPAEFADLLRITAIDAGDVGYNYRYGYGIVSVPQMLDGMVVHQVRYELNGGYWDGDAPVTSYTPYFNGDVVLTGQIPHRDGWFFGGWYDTADCAGDKVDSFNPTAGRAQRTCYANWIENVTDLASVTLDGYAAERIDEENWVVYLPVGTDIPEDVDSVGVTYAYSGVLHTLGHLITKADNSWVIGMTQNTNNDIYEDSYYLTADNTTYHAPERLTAQIEGTATPMSLDEATDPVQYCADLSAWFADADEDTLEYLVSEEPIVGLFIEDGTLRYKPPVAMAGETVRFTVAATDGRFTSQAVSVTIQVDELPLSTPTLSDDAGIFSAATPAELNVGYTAYDNTLTGLWLGDTALENGTDYTMFTGEIIDGSASTSDYDTSLYPNYVTLKSDYLATLTAGRYALVFRFDTGRRDHGTQDVTYTLTVDSSCIGDHDWDEGAVTTQAACETDGTLTYTCRRCGAVRSEVIPASGHDYEEDVCTRCGAQRPGSGSADIPAPGTADLTAPRETVSTYTAGNGSVVTTRTAQNGDRAITVTTPQGETVVNVSLPGDPGAGRSFADVSGTAWYKDAVEKAAAFGLFKGTSVRDFSPNEGMTRGMLLSVLYQLGGTPDYGTDRPAFGDAGGAWYTNAVAWGCAAGITSGVSATAFLPEQAVTREQLVTMLFRFAGLLSEVDCGSADTRQFRDKGSISGYARDAMAWAVAEGLLSGRTAPEGLMLAPQAVATRAEAAAICVRFVDYLKK